MKMFIKRIYAALIDITVVNLVLFIGYYMYLYNGSQTGVKLNVLDFYVEYRLLSFVAMLVYFILCELLEKSIGKKIFKIKIEYGKYVKTAKFLRPFFKILTMNFYPVVAISIFLKRKLIIYDYILKTDVVEDTYERRDLR